MSTTPDIPYRLEFSVEVPGTPEQVWQAIATSEGISSWFLPTDVEERQGGAIVTHMGETSSPGTITGWEPPRRLAYEEPDWATLAGHAGAPVTPLATEFLVEARSGGTCVVRVVSSAFGTGADWEREFFAEMAKGWTPMFDHLCLYLAHFAGRRVTQFEASTDLPGAPAAAVAAIRNALDIDEGSVGGSVDARGATAVVERVAEESVLLRLTAPVPGLLAFFAFRSGEDRSISTARVAGYLFSDDAPAYIEREQPAWQGWLEGLAIPAS